MTTKSNVIQLKQDISWEEQVNEFVKGLKEKKITHAVVAYRSEDGSFQYRIFGADHATYMVGMLERVKQDIHNADWFGCDDCEVCD